MGIKDTLLALGKKVFEKPEPTEELGDDETRDKYLRSLRRQDRTQQEKIEKIRLKKKIAAFQQREVRDELFGIKAGSVITDSDVIRKKVMIKSIIARGEARKNVLNEDMLRQTKKKSTLLGKGYFIK